MSKITWTQALDAMYGVQLSDSQVLTWEHYLKREGTNSRELVPAIEQAAENNVKPLEWRVTARDLIRWIKMYRAKNFNPQANLGAFEAKFMADWTNRIANGASEEDFLDAVRRLPTKISIMEQIENQVLTNGGK